MQCACAMVNGKVAKMHTKHSSNPGISITCELLGSGNPPVTKAALGLVQNLAGCVANLAPMRDHRSAHNHSFTFLVGEILRDAMDACREAARVHCLHLKRVEKKTSKQLQQGALLPVWDGVQVLSIVEAAAGALQMMARDKVMRQNMCQAGLVPLLIEVRLKK